MLTWVFLILRFAFVFAETTPCPEELTADITIGTKLENGSIFWEGITFDKDKYYEKKDDNGFEIRGCVCEYKPCFRKCCPWGEAYTSSESKCNKSVHELSENFNVPIYAKNGEEKNFTAGHFHVLHGNKCKHNMAYILDPLNFPEDRHYLMEDGTLLQTGTERNFTHKPDEYCFEVFEADNITVARVCFDQESDDELREEIYSTGMMISLPFLLVTFLVYAFIPELRNLHGLCLMCYVASLFIAYLFLIISQIGHHIINQELCEIFVFIIYCAFMASFLWLNIMCVDIWWIFRKLMLGFNGKRGFVSSGRQSEQRRFLIYNIFAWGLALIMVSITATMQYADLPNNIVKPNIGKGTCWFDGFYSTLYYLYGPMMFLILVNIFLFFWTIYLIYQIQKLTKSIRTDNHRTGKDSETQRFKLYLKLSIVFGVNWSMEILSWFLPDYKALWYLTDFCNALYGVLIFFIFVCKANVWKLVKQRYNKLTKKNEYMKKSLQEATETPIT